MAHALNTRLGTLVADTPTTATYDRDVREVAITHFGNVSDPIWVRLDGTAAAKSTNGNGWILPGETKVFSRTTRAASSTDDTSISLVCGGAAQYGVEFP